LIPFGKLLEQRLETLAHPVAMTYTNLLAAAVFASSVLLPASEAASARPPALPTLVYFQLSLNGLRKIDAVDSSVSETFQIADPAMTAAPLHCCPTCM
jgi:hypothetical protein